LNLPVFVASQPDFSGNVIVFVLEPEIHYAVRDGLAVLVLHQVLIVTAYISEEGLAELEVLRMIIDVEIFLD